MHPAGAGKTTSRLGPQRPFWARSNVFLRAALSAWCPHPTGVGHFDGWAGAESPCVAQCPAADSRSVSAARAALRAQAISQFNPSSGNAGSRAVSVITTGRMTQRKSERFRTLGRFIRFFAASLTESVSEVFRAFILRNSGSDPELCSCKNGLLMKTRLLVRPVVLRS